MPKALCIVGAAVSGLVLLVFGLNLVLGILPGDSMLMNIGFIICSLILGYLSWSTYREQV